MRFVSGYYLAQTALLERREPRKPRRRTTLRLPVTQWLAALRPARVTARGGQPAQAATASRTAS